MAKSDTPLDEILTYKAYSPPREPDFAENKAINGFDTETADGGIFMLSYAWEGEEGEVIENNGNFLEAETIWNILTHYKARSSLNMWYNLNFDANVLLRHVLDREQMAHIITEATVSTEKYDIMFIPGKFLKIKDDNNNSIIHFDAAQFFYTSLDNAVDEWLNETKANEGFTTKKFGEENQEEMANEYIMNNWFEIRKYARKDAELVRDLWKEAVDVSEEIDIPMGKPFSTGYLAESYLNNYLDEKPGMGPSHMSSLAWEAYAGGRFEVFKRGNVGRVVGPDINSAYPAILAGLPDPKTLRWHRHDSPSIETLREADYGFVRAKMTTDASRTIQPFAYKVDGTLKYPALENQETSTLKEIFVHAYDNDLLVDYEIVDCWLGYETKGTERPFDFIEGLYKERKEAEANGFYKRALFIKIVLNSMYGKLCQTTPKRKKLEEAIELEAHQDFVSSMSLPKMLRGEYENGFIEWLESGSYYNPFLAAYITGGTRLELHKRVLEQDLEENTVMFATDCLMIEEEAYEKSDFSEKYVEKGLGNWDFDYEGEAFVIGAGIYQIDFDDCKEKSCDGFGDTPGHCRALGHTRKEQTRGFRELDLGHASLKESARRAKDGHIEIESLRPKTVAEAIWRGEEISDIGQFMEFTRKLNPDMDSSRNWNQKATWRNLLNESMGSKPLRVSD